VRALLRIEILLPQGRHGHLPLRLFLQHNSQDLLIRASVTDIRGEKA
jgi:hypothetical protein